MDQLNRPVTMEDVARAAGVSAKTVSNVLRDAAGASPTTRERVLAAAHELGYQRHAGAAALRSGRHDAVTLAVPTLLQPVYADLAARLMQALDDVPVLLELTGGDLAHERRLVAGSWRAQSDVLILVPRALDPRRLREEEVHPGLVLVAHDGPAWVSRVTCSPLTQAVLVAGHLRSLGARSAAVLGVALDADRWTGTTVATLREDGLTVPDEAVLTVSQPDGLRGGVEACTRLLYRGPRVDALVCHNDAVAAAAAATLRRRGLDVPRDVLVVGRGDTETATFASPPLTSVSCGTSAMAQELARLVRRRSTEPVLAEVAPVLSVRESTATGLARADGTDRT